MRKSDTTRYFCKKETENPYDPQMAAAAKANVALATRTQEWTEGFYEDNIIPMLSDMRAQSSQQQANQNKLFDLNYGQAKLSADRFTALGIPAEEKYYGMAHRYSEPAYADRFANEQLGDTRSAFANAYQTLNRRNASYGVDPTSPAAMYARNDLARNSAIAEAAAMTRARRSAKDLGISLTSDAANFGRGGGSQLTQFGAGASQNSMGAFGIANQALAGAGAATNPMFQSAGIQGNAHTANLNAYTSAGNTYGQINSQAGGGIGSMLGSVVGAGASLLSDRGTKFDINRIGALSKDVGWYTFRYKHDPDTVHQGVMADEVKSVMPEAVITLYGVDHVDYAMLGDL